MAELQKDKSESAPETRGLKAGGGQEDPGTPESSFWRRTPIIVIGSLVLAAVLFLGLRYLGETFTYESTDDAFLDADFISVAPKVAGQVLKVHVASNQKVSAGDLLVEIDPRDMQVQLDQKKAALSAAEANVGLLKASVDLLRTQITTAEATAKQSAAEAAAAEANTEKAKADFKRAQDLIENHTISPQEFDSAKAATAWADANLKAQQEKADSDRTKIAQTQAQLEAGIKAWERGQAQTRQAEWDVQAAELNLSYTRVTAPDQGYVTKKAVESGDYLQVGQHIMALVPANGLYITANFKETQLQTIRPHQTVKITVDSVEKGPYSGHVESIQAGSGAQFSLLPPENAVGNYVKVVQRVPVKILFDNPLEAGHALGPGMSAVPSVHVTNYEVSEALVAVAAAVLALIAGAVWAAFARKESK
jgi:membrane fusion protein (multidrug efflux system)